MWGVLVSPPTPSRGVFSAPCVLQLLVWAVRGSAPNISHEVLYSLSLKKNLFHLLHWEV